MSEFNNKLVSFERAAHELNFSKQGVTDLITHCNAIKDSYGVSIQYIPDEDFNMESFITEREFSAIKDYKENNLISLSEMERLTGVNEANIYKMCNDCNELYGAMPIEATVRTYRIDGEFYLLASDFRNSQNIFEKEKFIHAYEEYVDCIDAVRAEVEKEELEELENSERDFDQQNTSRQETTKSEEKTDDKKETKVDDNVFEEDEDDNKKSKKRKKSSLQIELDAYKAREALIIKQNEERLKIADEARRQSEKIASENATKHQSILDEIKVNDEKLRQEKLTQEDRKRIEQRQSELNKLEQKIIEDEKKRLEQVDKEAKAKEFENKREFEKQTQRINEVMQAKLDEVIASETKRIEEANKALQNAELNKNEAQRKLDEANKELLASQEALKKANEDKKNFEEQVERSKVAEQKAKEEKDIAERNKREEEKRFEEAKKREDTLKEEEKRIYQEKQTADRKANELKQQEEKERESFKKAEQNKAEAEKNLARAKENETKKSEEYKNSIAAKESAEKRLQELKAEENRKRDASITEERKRAEKNLAEASRREAEARKASVSAQKTVTKAEQNFSTQNTSYETAKTSYESTSNQYRLAVETKNDTNKLYNEYKDEVRRNNEVINETTKNLSSLSTEIEKKYQEYEKHISATTEAETKYHQSIVDVSSKQYEVETQHIKTEQARSDYNDCINAYNTIKEQKERIEAYVYGYTSGYTPGVAPPISSLPTAPEYIPTKYDTPKSGESYQKGSSDEPRVIGGFGGVGNGNGGNYAGANTEQTSASVSRFNDFSNNNSHISYTSPQDTVRINDNGIVYELKKENVDSFYEKKNKGEIINSNEFKVVGYEHPSDINTSNNTPNDGVNMDTHVIEGKFGLTRDDISKVGANLIDNIASNTAYSFSGSEAGYGVVKTYRTVVAIAELTGIAGAVNSPSNRFSNIEKFMNTAGGVSSGLSIGSHHNMSSTYMTTLINKSEFDSAKFNKLADAENDKIVKDFLQKNPGRSFDINNPNDIPQELRGRLVPKVDGSFGMSIKKGEINENAANGILGKMKQDGKVLGVDRARSNYDSYIKSQTGGKSLGELSDLEIAILMQNVNGTENSAILKGLNISKSDMRDYIKHSTGVKGFGVGDLGEIGNGDNKGIWVSESIFARDKHGRQLFDEDGNELFISKKKHGKHITTMDVNGKTIFVTADKKYALKKGSYQYGGNGKGLYFNKNTHKFSTREIDQNIDKLTSYLGGKMPLKNLRGLSPKDLLKLAKQQKDPLMAEALRQLAANMNMQNEINAMLRSNGSFARRFRQIWASAQKVLRQNDSVAGYFEIKRLYNKLVGKPLRTAKTVKKILSSFNLKKRNRKIQRNNRKLAKGGLSDKKVNKLTKKNKKLTDKTNKVTKKLNNKKPSLKQKIADKKAELRAKLLGKVINALRARAEKSAVAKFALNFLKGALKVLRAIAEFLKAFIQYIIIGLGIILVTLLMINVNLLFFGQVGTLICGFLEGEDIMETKAGQTMVALNGVDKKLFEEIDKFGSTTNLHSANTGSYYYAYGFVDLDSLFKGVKTINSPGSPYKSSSITDSNNFFEQHYYNSSGQEIMRKSNVKDLLSIAYVKLEGDVSWWEDFINEYESTVFSLWEHTHKCSECDQKILTNDLYSFRTWKNPPANLSEPFGTSLHYHVSDLYACDGDCDGDGTKNTYKYNCKKSEDDIHDFQLWNNSIKIYPYRSSSQQKYLCVVNNGGKVKNSKEGCSSYKHNTTKDITKVNRYLNGSNGNSYKYTKGYKNSNCTGSLTDIGVYRPYGLNKEKNRNEYCPDIASNSYTSCSSSNISSCSNKFYIKHTNEEVNSGKCSHTKNASAYCSVDTCVLNFNSSYGHSYDATFSTNYHASLSKGSCNNYTEHSVDIKYRETISLFYCADCTPNKTIVLEMPNGNNKTFYIHCYKRNDTNYYAIIDSSNLASYYNYDEILDNTYALSTTKCSHSNAISQERTYVLKEKEVFYDCNGHCGIHTVCGGHYAPCGEHQYCPGEHTAIYCTGHLDTVATTEIKGIYDLFPDNEARSVAGIDFDKEQVDWLKTIYEDDWGERYGIYFNKSDITYQLSHSEVSLMLEQGEKNRQDLEMARIALYCSGQILHYEGDYWKNRTPSKLSAPQIIQTGEGELGTDLKDQSGNILEAHAILPEELFAQFFRDTGKKDSRGINRSGLSNNAFVSYVAYCAGAVDDFYYDAATLKSKLKKVSNTKPKQGDIIFQGNTAYIYIADIDSREGYVVACRGEYCGVSIFKFSYADTSTYNLYRRP